MKPLTASLSAAQRQQLQHQGATVAHIGCSENGEDLYAYTLGSGSMPRISVVAGAHPDEPAGPVAALLLAQRYAGSEILQQFRLCVVPQLDIDGTLEQRDWLEHMDDAVDPLSYVQHRLRRLPGADREFAWPGSPWNGCVLPECAAADDFLNAQGPALAHLSLHGMAVAEGAWFLLDHLAMGDAALWQDLRQLAVRHQFHLHDSPRYGDKGFRRCGKGFCTTPGGAAMRLWALRNEEQFKNGFGFGSMDAARARARRQHKPLPLCAVSEFPLLEIRNPGDGRWRQQIQELALNDDPETRLQELRDMYGLFAVPFERQVHAMLDMIEAVAAAALRRKIQLRV